MCATSETEKDVAMLSSVENRWDFGVECVGIAGAIDHCSIVFVDFQRWVRMRVDPEGPECVVEVKDYQ